MQKSSPSVTSFNAASKDLVPILYCCTLEKNLTFEEYCSSVAFDFELISANFFQSFCIYATSISIQKTLCILAATNLPHNSHVVKWCVKGPTVGKSLVSLPFSDFFYVFWSYEQKTCSTPSCFLVSTQFSRVPANDASLFNNFLSRHIGSSEQCAGTNNFL